MAFAGRPRKRKDGTYSRPIGEQRSCMVPPSSRSVPTDIRHMTSSIGVDVMRDEVQNTRGDNVFHRLTTPRSQQIAATQRVGNEGISSKALLSSDAVERLRRRCSKQRAWDLDTSIVAPSKRLGAVSEAPVTVEPVIPKEEASRGANVAATSTTAPTSVSVGVEWGSYVDAMLFKKGHQQARPPPSTSSAALSFEALLLHERVSTGKSVSRRCRRSHRSASRDSTASTWSDASIRKASPSEWHRRVTPPLRKHRAGSAKGLGRPRNAVGNSCSCLYRSEPVAQRLDWNQVNSEAELVKKFRTCSSTPSEVEPGMGPVTLLERRAWSTDSFRKSAKDGGPLLSGSPRAQSQEPSLLADPIATPRRLRNSGVCAPTRGTWESVFPTRELHVPLPPGSTVVI